MYKISFNIGTLAGIAAFLLFLGCYYLGLSPLSIGKFLGFWIPIVAVIWGNLSVRAKVLNGEMTYMQGFLSGSIIIFTWCTFKAFCMYIFMITFKQNVIEQYITFTENYLQFVENISGESFKDKIDIDKLATQLTPSNIMWGDINANAIFGLFITLIISFITKKKINK